MFAMFEVAKGLKQLKADTNLARRKKGFRMHLIRLVMARYRLRFAPWCVERAGRRRPS